MIFTVSISSIQKSFSTLVKFCRYPLILVFALLFSQSCHLDVSPTLLAKDGVLDVRMANLSEDTVNLIGKWEFYWNEFLDPKQISPTNISYLSVGVPWFSQANEDGVDYPSFGYASYRLTILLPPKTEERETYALLIPVLHSAYKIYANGKLVAENGIIGKNDTTHKPSFHTKIIPLIDINQKVDLVIHISNFSHKYAGIHGIIRFGKLEKIIQVWNEYHSATCIILIFMGLLSIYHALVYAINRSEKNALRMSFVYLGILILSATLTETRILFNFLSDDYCIPLFRLSRVGFVIVLYFGGSVLFSLAQMRIFKKMLVLLKIYSLTFLMVSLLTPIKHLALVSYYFEFFSVIFVILGLISVSLALYFQRKESKLYFFSLLLAVIGGIIDVILISNPNLGFRPMGLISLYLFIFPQTLGVTFGLIRVYKRSESISKELYKRKEALEKKVKARTDELEKANRWKANFVSLISHDLRSPLNSVNQILDVIDFSFSETSEEEKKKFLDICKTGVTQSLKMLEQLLDVSRFDAFGTKLIQTKFSVNDLLNEIIESVEPLATLKGIRIQKDTPIEAEIIADRTLIGEVFKNILTNSIKYSYLNSEVWVGVSYKGKWLSVEIRDRGLGMSEEQIHKLTGEENIKSTPGTAGERGTGLGLQLCNNILEAHFGKLRIKSVLGVGSSFEISLSKSTKSVLLVDDSGNFRSDLAEVMRRNQWIVIEAGNGEEALSHLARITPSLIITDLHMPGMNGISLIHEWEGRRNQNQKIPIILISSDAPLSGGNSFLEEEGLETIVSAYFSKMYKAEDLCEQIEMILM
ncbi:Sensor histidine kinase and response regulator of a two component complex [Leptospira biflexa serovar Patoc strain 'Patoc 1 (Ames)']|uniref:histidine kinase n=1 Tax=Leptospira biflexa serovar Patoc (strain Patoc 1 / ATCC 23582 / Paris) TaxID=456481 RepID=B0SQ67_LEPBP|nr:ATP-binding protein [Leptospira biflexa]ABZ95514.1 Sensor histidine kinase and response regulator of a two component complex [Leptospira biflexa serovar Patoc strain 'Patoc 1 (Ames)']ABZ99219.1 Putative regulatory protein; putative membrane protein; putative signal peptide [Leptospira biflexa serovar Patoc strain 'Patoc 1 (Paris)']